MIAHSRLDVNERLIRPLKDNPAVKEVWSPSASEDGGGNAHELFDLQVIISPSHCPQAFAADWAHHHLEALYVRASDSVPTDSSSLLCILPDGFRLRLTVRTAAALSANQDHFEVRERIADFWSYFLSLPEFMVKNERLKLHALMLKEADLLITVISQARRKKGLVRHKADGEFNLTPEILQEIEGTISLAELTMENLTSSHLTLARLMQEEGRLASRRCEVEYPKKIEDIAMAEVFSYLESRGK